MAIRRYEDLIAWQLAFDVHRRVLELTAREKVKRDREFCDEPRQSSAAVPANIAEGFGRFGRREFRQYLRIARGSLNEAGTRLRDGHCRGYFSDSELADVLHLLKRTGICITRLIQSLERPPSTPDTPPAGTDGT